MERAEVPKNLSSYLNPTLELKKLEFVSRYGVLLEECL